MAEPPVSGFGAPVRRPVGRLGLIAILVIGVLALAVTTRVQAVDQTEPSDASDLPDATPESTPPGASYAFGSVTAEGAILFRLGETVQASSVDTTGAVHWQRDLEVGDYIVCGPCPGAIVKRPDGRASAVAADGSSTTAPPGVAEGLVDTRSLIGVVLAVARSDGRVEFLIPTSEGLVSAGSVEDPRLDQPLIVVTPASGASAVTILRASSDPLRQGEFEVVHVTPGGSTLRTVPLDEPGARPFPSAVADTTTVAYLQQRPGPTSDGSTHVVVRADDGVGVETTVPGTFDTCAAGPDGVVLGSAVTGADGDLTRAEVRLVWLGPSLEVTATMSEAVASATASLAVDPRSRRVAVGGGSDPAVVLDGTSRVERPPAAALAFDDRGGLWQVAADAQVTHESRP